MHYFGRFFFLHWTGRRDREEDHPSRGQGAAHAAPSEYRVPQGSVPAKGEALPRVRVRREEFAGGTGGQSGWVALRGCSRVRAPFFHFLYIVVVRLGRNSM